MGYESIKGHNGSQPLSACRHSFKEGIFEAQEYCSGRPRTPDELAPAPVRGKFTVPCALAGGDARIKVIGVGGGGGNAINRMVSSGLQVLFYCSRLASTESVSDPFSVPVWSPCMERALVQQSGTKIHRAAKAFSKALLVPSAPAFGYKGGLAVASEHPLQRLKAKTAQLSILQFPRYLIPS